MYTIFNVFNNLDEVLGKGMARVNPGYEPYDNDT